MPTKKTLFVPLGIAALVRAPVPAEEVLSDEGRLTVSGDHAGIRADGHAPIGVMGDHVHAAGEWMLSDRFMHMAMEGNRLGTDGVTPETIATARPNLNPGPPTLRVVPTEMTTDMHMFGAMHAPTDWLTQMGMGSYQVRKMNHVTFQGVVGATRVGKFSTKSSGAGDIRMTGLLSLYDDGTHHIHATAGLSLPTGSIDESDDVLEHFPTILNHSAGAIL